MSPGMIPKVCHCELPWLYIISSGNDLAAEPNHHRQVVEPDILLKDVHSFSISPHGRGQRNQKLIFIPLRVCQRVEELQQQNLFARIFSFPCEFRRQKE